MANDATVVHITHEAVGRIGVFASILSQFHVQRSRVKSCAAPALVLAMIMGLSLPMPAQAGRPDTLQNPGPPQEVSHVPGEVLVLLSSDINRNGVIEAGENLSRVEEAVRGTVLKRISLRHGQRVLRVKLPAGKSVEKAMAENWRRKDRRIISVEPNYRLHVLALPNDSLWSNLWGLNNTGQTSGTADADIDAPEAWDITTGSSSVIVAVIDTGIDYLHPDLADNMWVNTGEIPDNGIDDDGNGYIDDVYGYDFVQDDGDPLDEHSHGTHCAGTIAGRGNNGLGVAGVNWQCQLMACRFLDAGGSGTTADAISAINYAVANGADILSNSWGGGGYSAALEAAIINARDNGVLFVAAAGNSGTDNDAIPHYPSSYQVSNVIAVAATDHDDALAGFSCYGLQSVHVGAPGVSILSSVLDGAYDSYNGTSMATPHVAGVSALLLANDPAMSLQDLKARIVWTGEAIPSLDNKTISGRRLNAYNALTAEPCMRVLAPNDGESWAQGFTWAIEWISIGGAATVDIYLLKAGEIHTQLADNVTNEGTFNWNISESLPAGSDYRIQIDDGTSADESDTYFTITDEPTDYFTEQFSSGSYPFDLSNKSMLLMPEGSSGYLAYMEDITELPTDPAGSTQLFLGDDGSQLVSLTGASVFLYGVSYATFYVGSNGYITFESTDTDYSESLGDHFGLKRISGLFRDFNPSSSGTVSWKQLGDRAVVTWENVPEYRISNSNTFQIEMFFDRRTRLSWLGVAAQDGVVGMSEGLGIQIDFLQTDLSEYTEFGTPPVCRFWSPTNNRHFYTISEAEKDGLIANYPDVWTYESVAYYAFETDAEPGLLPVYRFWSPVLVAHFYTTSESEKQKLIDNYSHVWTYEGIAFYAYPEGQQPQDAKPVYRFWSPVLETHFYTMSETEKNKLIDNYSHVWTYEGVAWYAYE